MSTLYPALLPTLCPQVQLSAVILPVQKEIARFRRHDTYTEFKGAIEQSFETVVDSGSDGDQSDEEHVCDSGGGGGSRWWRDSYEAEWYRAWVRCRFMHIPSKPVHVPIATETSKFFYFFFVLHAHCDPITFSNTNYPRWHTTSLTYLRWIYVVTFHSNISPTTQRCTNHFQSNNVGSTYLPTRTLIHPEALVAVRKSLPFRLFTPKTRLFHEIIIINTKKNDFSQIQES